MPNPCKQCKIKEDHIRELESTIRFMQACLQEAIPSMQKALGRTLSVESSRTELIAIDFGLTRQQAYVVEMLFDVKDGGFIHSKEISDALPMEMVNDAHRKDPLYRVDHYARVVVRNIRLKQGRHCIITRAKSGYRLSAEFRQKVAQVLKEPA